MLQHRGTDSVDKCHYINNYCWFGILTLAILMTISVSEKLFPKTFNHKNKPQNTNGVNKGLQHLIWAQLRKVYVNNGKLSFTKK